MQILGELPFETYQRAFGCQWPGGCSQEIIRMLDGYGITHPPGSAEANLALQDKLERQYGKKRS